MQSDHSAKRLSNQKSHCSWCTNNGTQAVAARCTTQFHQSAPTSPWLAPMASSPSNLKTPQGHVTTTGAEVSWGHSHPASGCFLGCWACLWCVARANGAQPIHRLIISQRSQFEILTQAFSLFHQMSRNIGLAHLVALPFQGVHRANGLAVAMLAVYGTFRPARLHGSRSLNLSNKAKDQGPFFELRQQLSAGVD